MNVNSQAKRDAEEYARSRMFYGQGAGTRRKLISAQVGHRSENVPGYEEAFAKHIDKQDMEKHAKKAKQERFQKDTAKKIERNVRALSSGNKHNLTGGVAVALGVVWVLHETEYDKVVIAKTKSGYAKSKAWVQKKRDQFQIV